VKQAKRPGTWNEKIEGARGSPKKRLGVQPAQARQYQTTFVDSEKKSTVRILKKKLKNQEGFKSHTWGKLKKK